MKGHGNKGIVLRQTRVMYISKHTVWGNNEMMNISCCQILESPIEQGSALLKEQIIPLLA